MNRSYAAGFLIVVTGASMRAQDPADTIAYTAPVNIEFMSDPVTFDPEPVIGAPYSAEAITDVVQTLSDGNRIVRQNKAQVSRDSQGRTRREQGFAMFGPLVNGPRADEHRSVQISDPATGGAILLDLRNRTAHKMPAPPRVVLRRKIAAVNGNTAVEIALPPSAEARGGVMFNRVEAVAARQVPKPVTESLGTQFMEGIAVEGTRTTVTIPAGEIGNELPINIVSERWFSPDLKVLVMSRQSDPRFGETTYRLTGITRAEPPPSLFEIPADFKIVDPMANRNVVIEKSVK